MKNERKKMRILVVIYHKVGDKWVNSNDVLAEYFVDGIRLCTRWKQTADSDELREDGTTYTATFEMTKVN
jgi:hypothetical protein